MPVDFSPTSTASVVCSDNKEMGGLWGVGCAGGGGVLAAIEFEQPDQGTGRQRRHQCNRTESMGIPEGNSGMCAEVEHHTQAHREAKGTLHNTPHTRTKQKNTRW